MGYPFSSLLFQPVIWTWLTVLFLSCTADVQDSGPVYTVIENTTIIDVVNGMAVPDQMIVIKDSIVHGVSTDIDPDDFKGAIRVDGRGKYVIPGLWDMHFHLCWDSSNDSLLFKPLLSHGITGIRDMGGDLAIQNAMKQKIKADPSLGPEIYGAGPMLDGNPPVHYDFTVPLDENSGIQRLLDSISSSGSDFIKVYSLLEEAQLRQISDYSSARGTPFAGHLSEYVEPEKSIALGQKSIEHLNRLEEIWNRDKDRIDRLAQLMRRSDTWLCPTLIIYYTKAHMSDPSIVMDDYNSLIHPVLMLEWQTGMKRRIALDKGKDPDDIKNTFDAQAGLVGRMHHQGVRILAGSDFAGMPYVYPGIGLHQELALLCRAGLSPAEALATATINPAVYLAVDDKYGAVSEGKIADLVILNKNPLEKIENTRSVHTVLRKGKMVPDLRPVQLHANRGH